jgi:hypothetical protein
VILGALYGMFWFALFLVTQLILVRALPPEFRLAWNKRSVVIALIVISATVGPLLRLTDVATLASGGWLLGALWGDLTFLCLYVLYMPFYFVVMTSLSVETLVMLAKHGGGTLPAAQLRARFASEAFAADRFDTMVRSGLLEKMPGGYSVTKNGKRVARPFLFVKALWRLGTGG